MLSFIIIVAILLALIYVIKRSKNRFESHHVDLDEVNAFLENNGGNHVSHLTFINDKRVFWTSNKKSLIIYQKVANKLIILGDPIGRNEDVQDAIAEFNHFANFYKLKPVFYQVSEKYLSSYRKAGYELFKLGEEAKVNLHDFSLSGKKAAKLRTNRNKFEKNGFQFQIVQPPYSDEFLTQIREISDSWLGDRKEKGFSVGFYCDQYISRFPLAILKNTNGSPIAFATMACDAQKENKTITIDLMRYLKSSPHGTMDVLFLSIFNWCKDQGYDWCSMGMAPLSHLENEQTPTVFERVARFTFHHGNYFYNFKGLFHYKNKFYPLWEPRYLAYKKTFLPILFLQLIYLINSKENSLQRVKTIKRRLLKTG